MKDDVVSLAGKKRTERKKRRPAVGRLLPRWPEYLDYEEWVDANSSLVLARTHWGHYENLLSRVLQRAEEEGWLLRANSWALLELFRDGKPPTKGRPTASAEDQARAQSMAVYSYLLESVGDPTESAVNAAAKLHGVSRPTVFAARRRSHPPQEILDRWRADPKYRERQRRWQEALAKFFQEAAGDRIDPKYRERLRRYQEALAKYFQEGKSK